jgi:hypothetical protein
MLKKNPHKVVQYNEGRVEETAFWIFKAWDEF